MAAKKKKKKPFTPFGAAKQKTQGLPTDDTNPFAKFQKKKKKKR